MSGWLPVIADFSRRLDIAGIIDRVCPMRDIAVVSHGQVVDPLLTTGVGAIRQQDAEPKRRHTPLVGARRQPRAVIENAKVAVVGVGNNTSALVQGINFHRSTGSLVE